jgi:catechol-2,3-dioxygenase
LNHPHFTGAGSPGPASRPPCIAHYGIRTKRLREMVEWYRTVFFAHVQHQNDSLAFLTFDEEHHRLVIFEDPATVERPENVAGIDHMGYGLASFDDFVATYKRLKAKGITPFLPLNHGFTTSLYYHDPDGNEVELSVDNFPSKEECNAFVASERMAEIGRPPFGYRFDPEELVGLFRAGAPRQVLARLGIPDDR